MCLENRLRAISQGFESLSLRQKQQFDAKSVELLFFEYKAKGFEKSRSRFYPGNIVMSSITGIKNYSHNIFCIFSRSGYTSNKA